MLKTQSNKTVDLSQPFRLSGLANGAKLQLTQASRSPSVVNVALQLPQSENGGSRVSDKFPSTTTLWQVLRKFEDAVAGGSSKKLNVTQRGIHPDLKSGSGRLEYEQPCAHLMGRNLESFTDLQKTLAQLGINGGSVLIRLTFKPSGQPLEHAMAEMEQYFRAVNPEPANGATSALQDSHAPDRDAPTLPSENTDTCVSLRSADPALPADGSDPIAVIDSAMPDDVNQSADVPEQTTTASCSQTPAAAVEPSLTELSHSSNAISVYHPPSSDTPAAALHQDDPSTFEPSIDHAKAHQAALQRATRNTRLLSDAEIASQEASRQAHLNAVQSATVRVRFPDQSMIQFVIAAPDSGANLYARAREALAYPDEPFDLRAFPSKNPGPGRGVVQQISLADAENLSLIHDLGFRGKVLVTLVWVPETSEAAKQAPSLKAEYRNRAEVLKVELPSEDKTAASGSGERSANMLQQDDANGSNDSKGKGKGDLEAKMKKFLGFGKK
ncbi:hypothetical protein MRB53_039714 [Persea americana]|nr:hypothetical protein MRB53_039714 [Persea americana]